MHFRRKVCCLVITALNLNCKTVLSIVKKHLQILSFTFWWFCSIIMNHLLGPYVCRRPYWWSPKAAGEGEGEQGQHTYQAEMFPCLQEILKWQPLTVLCLIMLCFISCWITCMVYSVQRGCLCTLILTQTDGWISGLWSLVSGVCIGCWVFKCDRLEYLEPHHTRQFLASLKQWSVYVAIHHHKAPQNVSTPLYWEGHGEGGLGTGKLLDRKPCG